MDPLATIIQLGSRHADLLANVNLVEKILFVLIHMIDYIRLLIRITYLQLSEPFCKPFGNRRLVHCSSSSSSEGETPAWVSCGRIIAAERADFTEFFAVNVVFAALALVVLFIRKRRQEGEKRRALTAKIWGGSGRSNG